LFFFSVHALTWTFTPPALNVRTLPSVPFFGALPLKTNVLGVQAPGVGVGVGVADGDGDGDGVGVGDGFGFGALGPLCCSMAFATRDLENRSANPRVANTGNAVFVANNARAVIRTNIFLIVVLLCIL
jgi:hypothetical protein